MKRDFRLICRLPESVIAIVVMMVAGCGPSAESAAVRLERARMLMQRNQAAEAIPLLDEVIASAPNDPDPRYERGVAFESLGVLEKALADYSECVKLDDARTDALNNKAVVLAKLKRFHEAAEEFSRLVALDPQGALAYRNRGLCRFDLADYETALADYEKALQLAPDDPANWYQRGQVYLAQGLFGEAEANYSRAVELAPDLALAWMNRGVARYRLGQMTAAAEDLKRAQSLNGTIVIPDIDFFSQVSAGEAGDTSQPGNPWDAVKEVARDELIRRGLSEILVIHEFPELCCGEFAAAADGTHRTVLVSCQRAEDETVVVPTPQITSSQPGAKKNAVSLLVLTSPVAASGARPQVLRFVDAWNSTQHSAEPVLMRYRLEEAGDRP